jgi:hypothetical protein
MNTKSRIASILKGNSLDTSVTGLPAFHLSALTLEKEMDFQLPTNIRLGHLAERIVSELIKSSSNYKLLYENFQIIEDQKTIGEIDFIIENNINEKLIHLELAYKFYLFDPSISTDPLYNWIGPNRNDSLSQKLDKLKSKQFPLLYQTCTISKLNTIDVDTVSQSLCLIASFFVPYEFKTQLSPAYEKAIKGYYLNLDTFSKLDDKDKSYYLPSKKEWGMEASEHKFWSPYKTLENQIATSINEKQAVLCWQKHKGTYLSFFIVWW